MKRLVLFFLGLSWSLASLALTGQAYMDRFNAFQHWYANIPIVPSQEFLEFVKGSTPLSNKLRDKWLYELARIKDWKNYNIYYQPTSDTNLVCYSELAKYNLGQEQEVLQSFKPLWLFGDSRPKSCNTLFDLLLKNPNFDQNLITQRIKLALDKRNISLARYLLKQYKVPHLAEVETLNAIYQRPTIITTLKPEGLNGDLYLYGLKRLFSSNMNQSISLWENPKTKQILSETQQQDFLAHVALHKALRNSDDAQAWFDKVKPQYNNDLLMEWQIRFALKNHAWNKMVELINQSKNKNTPCWQYWLARALDAKNNKEEANALYHLLAKTRNYYGFLASMRLNTKPSFEYENTTTNLNTLKPYYSVINQIRDLYHAKQSMQASRLLNDFISELPKEDASALVYWVDNELQWHGKSVYLSNTELLNNQLLLRFPLAYRYTVQSYAKQYAISPEFIYAIIRQESSFREDVVSSAGAKGLMQLMPRTASVISKISRIPYNDQKQLFVSQKNINIGVAYLKHLSRRFSNHPILIAAAYNAGPGQVINWLKNHSSREIDEWIETIPWQETRNYLKNVMAFGVVYQYRLNQKTNLNQFMMPI